MAEAIETQPDDAARQSRWRRLVFRELSWTTRVMLVIGGIIAPLICHAISLTGLANSPRWQTGELHDQLSYILTPTAGFVFYPLLIYAMVSLVVYLRREGKEDVPFFARLGIFGGVLLALWYCVIFSLVVARFELTLESIGYLGLALATQIVLPVVVYGIIQALKWLLRRFRIPVWMFVVVMLVLYFAVMIPLGKAGEGIAALFVWPILFSLVLGPIWALLVYGFVSARLLVLQPSARRMSLSSLIGVVTYAAVTCAAIRYSILLSLREYATLPVDPVSDCYVVTAAARGHRRIVGSTLVTGVRGQVRINRQLQRLKAGELALRAVFPQAHRGLRKVYDRIGPRFANLIRNAYLADLAYASLKPAEWLTTAILQVVLGRQTHWIDRLYGDSCESETRNDRHPEIDSPRPR